MIRLLIKNVTGALVLALFVFITNTAFATTEISGLSKQYLQTYQEEQVQETSSVDKQTEQYTFSPDVPINGLFWTIGSCNDKQGYWNTLGEFFEKLPDPTKE
ncbi:hypothetical protein [Desulfofarcimen acetoxidans]|uniref:hypothetical protein n=1 Tax=Desulfofarcimen acetoxidans TaxID=58138 RepID=UPI00019E4B6F|nr:hypothetical protein [Desulfofarcimen acetoxidans]